MSGDAPRIRRTWPLLVARLIFGLLFATAAIWKANDPDEFGRLMNRIANLVGIAAPATAVTILAAGVILIEALLAGLFVANIALRPASIAAALLLSAFTCALGVMLIKGGIRSCGCGGVLSLLPWGESLYLAIARNLVLIWALVWIAARQAHSHGRITQPTPARNGDASVKTA